MSKPRAVFRESVPFRFFFVAALGLLPLRAQEVNALSDAEKAQGWQLMFDGKSMSGWHSFQKTTITDNGWLIKDSAIYLRGPLPNGPATGALLAPEKFTYQNFEISLDWKIPDAGNSGIFLRYLETEPSENIRTGPESQVCGKLHADYQNGMKTTSPGACYGMYPPARPWIKSEDEYNTFVVVMYDSHVAHFGNGARLLEYVIGSDDWKAKFLVSKYASFDLYGDIHAGKLFLQDHASHVWYRNIKIRPLTEDPWASKDFVWPDQSSAISERRLSGTTPELLTTQPDGDLLLRLSGDGRWDLRLFDAGGDGLRSFRGTGSGSRILDLQGLKTGSYFLSGSIQGEPFASPILKIMPR